MVKTSWKTSDELVHLFQAIGRALLQCDMEDSHSGNIAMRFKDEQGTDRIAITATGSQKGDLDPNHICILSASETDYGFYKASSESDIHARILALEGIQGSVHAHTKDLTIEAMDDEGKPNQPAPFVPMDPLGHYHLEGVIPVDWVSVPSGSREMADKIVEKLALHPVTVIQGHGAFAKGKNVQEAFNRLCIANHAGYIVQLARKIGADVEGIRRGIQTNPEEHFSFPPAPFSIEGDGTCDFPAEDELIREFKKTGARIFESKVSPFHTGSLSVRGIRTMLYAPKASMPRDLPGPLLELPLAPDPSDSHEAAMHKAIYGSGNFQTIAHCYVPEAEALAHFIYPGEQEPADRVIPIDAEGSFLYLVVPVVPPKADPETLCRLLHDYKVVIVRGGGVWGVGMQSLSEVLHHPASVREVCLYRIGAFERGLDLRKLEPEQARRW